MILMSNRLDSFKDRRERLVTASCSLSGPGPVSPLQCQNQCDECSSPTMCRTLASPIHATIQCNVCNLPTQITLN